MNFTEIERKNKRPRQEQEEEEMDIGNDGVNIYRLDKGN